MKNIAILASGNGSNAQKIAEYFADNNEINIALILSNRKDAYVLERADKLNIPAFTFNRADFYETEYVLDKLKGFKIDFIVLAGFLWLLPDYLLKNYSYRIINIHPALLPKYGGKGMYGMKVHEAVRESGDTESGISIHYVNEKYDEGEIIFQAKVTIEENDTPEDIANKIHALEYEHFPRVIEEVLKKK